MGRVRIGTYDDIPQLLDYIETYHREDSNLQDIPFDRKSMAATLDYSISSRANVIYVYDDDGDIKGFIMGGLEQFPHNQKCLWASDVMFIANAGGSYLLKRFLSWAKAHNAKRVYMAVSTGNPAADALYDAAGLEYTGGMYRVVY